MYISVILWLNFLLSMLKAKGHNYTTVVIANILMNHPIYPSSIKNECPTKCQYFSVLKDALQVFRNKAIVMKTKLSLNFTKESSPIDLRLII